MNASPTSYLVLFPKLRRLLRTGMPRVSWALLAFSLGRWIRTHLGGRLQTIRLLFMIASLLAAALLVGLDNPNSGYTWSTIPEQPLAGASFEISIQYTVSSFPARPGDPLIVSIKNGRIVLDSQLDFSQVSINPFLPVDDRFIIPPLPAGTYAVVYFPNRQLAQPGSELASTVTVAGAVPLNVVVPLCIALFLTGVAALKVGRRP